MSSVQDQVLSRFLTLYGEPKTDNLEAFFDEYERSLGHFSAEVLRRAANRVIDEQVFKAWPTPGECRKAAEHAQQMMPKPKPTQAELDKQADAWPAATEESKVRVRELMLGCVANLRGKGSLTATTRRMTGEASE